MSKNWQMGETPYWLDKKILPRIEERDSIFKYKQSVQGKVIR
jgi:DNA-directed RNA polymerase subunit H (RpoH/RPB5)